MPKTRGFTLIELLVVVAIIAILSLIGTAVFSNAQKKARDTKRKADVDTIVKVYEQKYHPLSAKYSPIQASDFTSGQIPTPPAGGTYTGYSTTNTVSGFQICAKLEGFTGTCPATGVDQDRCYCRSSSLGRLATTPPPPPPPGGATPPPPTAPTSKPLSCENFGDLDKNKVLSESDSEILVKYDAGLLTPNNDERMIADVDYDGSKSFGPTDNDYLADATHLTQYISNKISQINVCTNAKSPPCTGMGDVSTDGRVTQLDAVEALRVFAGGFNSLYTGQPYTNDQKTRADVDNTGEVNPTDSLMIKQYLAGTRTTFPACPP